MKYFTLNELCASSTAKLNNIDNTPNKEEEGNLIGLVNNILDPLREVWGKPIRVNSGFRCMELNKVVGGAKNSQHLTGQAADITTGNKDNNKRLFDLIQEINLPFCQLIDEKNFSWIHVSYDPNNIKRQVLSL